MALAGSSSRGVGNKEDGCALILEPPQNFRVTWDHWQTDLGLVYIVRLNWCCSPNHPGFMTWGCLRTLRVFVLGDCQAGGEDRGMGRGVP